MKTRRPTRFLSYAFVEICTAVAFAATAVLGTQTQGVLSIPPDSPRWELEGQAKPADYQGRKSLLLDGGAAVLKDFEMRDGVVDVDVSTPASRGFVGIQFRIANGGANSELVYLRQHKSGYPDAMQYTPVLNTGLNWQLYNGPGFTGVVDIPKDVWFHLRLEVAGAQARLFVKDMDKPALVMNDLKSGVQKGQVGLYVLTGATYSSNFEIRSTTDVPWERHLPSMPCGSCRPNGVCRRRTMRYNVISNNHSRLPTWRTSIGRKLRQSHPVWLSFIADRRKHPTYAFRSRMIFRSGLNRNLE